MTKRTPQQEYVAALAAYTAAKDRLSEAKRHYDHKRAPEAIAARKAKQAEYRARRLAAWNAPEAKAQRERKSAEHQEWMRKWEEDYERRHRGNAA